MFSTEKKDINKCTYEKLKEHPEAFKLLIGCTVDEFESIYSTYLDDIDSTKDHEYKYYKSKDILMTGLLYIGCPLLNNNFFKIFAIDVKIDINKYTKYLLKFLQKSSKYNLITRRPINASVALKLINCLLPDKLAFPTRFYLFMQGWTHFKVDKEISQEINKDDKSECKISLTELLFYLKEEEVLFKKILGVDVKEFERLFNEFNDHIKLEPEKKRTRIGIYTLEEKFFLCMISSLYHQGYCKNSIGIRTDWFPEKTTQYIKTLITENMRKNLSVLTAQTLKEDIDKLLKKQTSEYYQVFVKMIKINSLTAVKTSFPAHHNITADTSPISSTTKHFIGTKRLSEETLSSDDALPCNTRMETQFMCPTKAKDVNKCIYEKLEEHPEAFKLLIGCTVDEFESIYSTYLDDIDSTKNRKYKNYKSKDILIAGLLYIGCPLLNNTFFTIFAIDVVIHTNKYTKYLLKFLQKSSKYNLITRRPINASVALKLIDYLLLPAKLAFPTRFYLSMQGWTQFKVDKEISEEINKDDKSECKISLTELLFYLKEEEVLFKKILGVDVKEFERLFNEFNDRIKLEPEKKHTRSDTYTLEEKFFLCMISSLYHPGYCKDLIGIITERMPKKIIQYIKIHITKNMDKNPSGLTAKTLKKDIKESLKKQTSEYYQVFVKMINDLNAVKTSFPAHHSITEDTTPISSTTEHFIGTKRLSEETLSSDDAKKRKHNTMSTSTSDDALPCNTRMETQFMCPTKAKDVNKCTYEKLKEHPEAFKLLIGCTVDEFESIYSTYLDDIDSTKNRKYKNYKSKDILMTGLLYIGCPLLNSTFFTIFAIDVVIHTNKYTKYLLEFLQKSSKYNLITRRPINASVALKLIDSLLLPAKLAFPTRFYLSMQGWTHFKVDKEISKKISKDDKSECKISLTELLFYLKEEEVLFKKILGVDVKEFERLSNEFNDRIKLEPEKKHTKSDTYTLEEKFFLCMISSLYHQGYCKNSIGIRTDWLPKKITQYIKIHITKNMDKNPSGLTAKTLKEEIKESLKKQTSEYYQVFVKMIKINKIINDLTAVETSFPAHHSITADTSPISSATTQGFIEIINDLTAVETSFPAHHSITEDTTPISSTTEHFIGTKCLSEETLSSDDAKKRKHNIMSTNTSDDALPCNTQMETASIDEEIYVWFNHYLTY